MNDYDVIFVSLLVLIRMFWGKNDLKKENVPAILLLNIILRVGLREKF